MWTILPSLRVAVLNAECLDTRSRPLSLTTPLIWLARLNCDCIWLYCASRISCLPVQYGSHPLHLTVGLQPSNTKVPGGSWDRTSLTPSRLQSFGPSLSVIRKLSAVPSTKKTGASGVSLWGGPARLCCQRTASRFLKTHPLASSSSSASPRHPASPTISLHVSFGRKENGPPDRDVPRGTANPCLVPRHQQHRSHSAN